MRTEVLFLTQNLERGGSQRQLVTLARGLSRRGHAVTVGVFYSGGPLIHELEADGVRIVWLDKRDRWDLPAFFARLVRLVRRERPLVIHGYLDVPNLLALLLRPLAPGSRIVWGVRSAYVDWSRFDRLTRAAFAVGCRLSRFADLIILNSFAGVVHHRALGYPKDRMVVVPNGIDTDAFAPNDVKRRRVRREWGISEAELLVGLVARLDPLKGHDTFIHAAARVAGRDPRVRFVCVGDGVPSFAAELQALAEREGVSQRLAWVTGRADMDSVYNALDLAVSTSIGEGFSNVIGESLATGVPCVVTDTGDSAVIVGDPALVVPPGDADALAAAIERVLARLTPAMKQRCRARVVEQFSVQRLVERTAEVLALPTPVVPSEPLHEVVGG
jgi:glycosyltransferase involved in cell wall biosynthesis